MLRVERLGCVSVELPVDEIVPPVVAAFGPADLLAGPPGDDDGMHVGAMCEGFVDVRLELRHRAAPEAAVGRHYDAGAEVEDAT